MISLSRMICVGRLMFCLHNQNILLKRLVLQEKFLLFSVMFFIYSSLRTKHQYILLSHGNGIENIQNYLHIWRWLWLSKCPFWSYTLDSLVGRFRQFPRQLWANNKRSAQTTAIQLRVIKKPTFEDFKDDCLVVEKVMFTHFRVIVVF